MSTPYEFGAGYAAGSDFVYDQDELNVYELYSTAATQTVTAPGTSAVDFSHVIGDVVATPMIAPGVFVTLPQQGVFLFNIHLNLGVTATGVVAVNLISKDGPSGSVINTWPLYATKPVGGEVSTGTLLIDRTLLVRNKAVSVKMPVYEIDITATTQNVTVNHDSGTTKKSMWQIHQIGAPMNVRVQPI